MGWQWSYAGALGPTAEDARLQCPDDGVEGDPEHRREEDGGPQLLGGDRVALAEEEDRSAEAGLNATRALADDRADHAGGGGDLHGGEQVRHRGGESDLEEDGPAGRRVGAHELKRPWVGGTQSPKHRDRHREEAEVH